MTQEREPEISPFKKFFEFQKFRLTRRAILSGERLYEWTPRERKSRDYLGPLHFNIQQSIFSGLPPLVLVTIFDYWYQIYKDPTEDDKLGQMFEGIYRVIYNFTTPILFTLFAYILARASLRRNDVTPDKVEKAKKAYLYFDGAYGLYSQALLSLAFSLIIWSQTHTKALNNLPPYLLFVGFILFLIAAIYQLSLTYWRIPKKLFKEVNGYTAGVSPCERYFFASVIGVPAISYFAIAALLLFSGMIVEILDQLRPH